MSRLRAAVATVSSGLGVASWSRWLLAMGVVGALGLCLGLWAGIGWERGAQARSTVREQRKDIRELRQAAQAIAQAGVKAAADHRAAAGRLESIADAYSIHDRERLQAAERRLNAQRERLLDARPDLWACDIGPGLLDHWNQGARGPAAGAAAEGAESAAAALPGAAAAGDRQPRPAAAGSEGR